MSETTGLVFFTNLAGATAAAGNAGTNPSDTLGTVVGVGQTLQAGASMIASSVETLSTPLAGAGGLLSLAGLLDNYNSSLISREQWVTWPRLSVQGWSSLALAKL